MCIYSNPKKNSVNLVKSKFRLFVKNSCCFSRSSCFSRSKLADSEDQKKFYNDGSSNPSSPTNSKHTPAHGETDKRNRSIRSTQRKRTEVKNSSTQKLEAASSNKAEIKGLKKNKSPEPKQVSPKQNKNEKKMKPPRRKLSKSPKAVHQSK